MGYCLQAPLQPTHLITLRRRPWSPNQTSSRIIMDSFATVTVIVANVDSIPTNEETGGSGANAYCVIAWEARTTRLLSSQLRYLLPSPSVRSPRLPVFFTPYELSEQILPTSHLYIIYSIPPHHDHHQHLHWFVFMRRRRGCLSQSLVWRVVFN